MVITHIMGGLGNQLFQYATGRKLALKHGVEQKIDISGFSIYKLHAFMLNNYDLPVEIALPEEITNYKPGTKNYLKLDTTLFATEFLQAPADCYLIGPWQSERYFLDIRDILLTELTPKETLSVDDRTVLEQIRTTKSVALHVRRGDFVTNSNHGTCDLKYYDRAIKYLTKTISNPTFFIFSDDPTWVEQNLKTEYPCIYIKHNDATKNYVDLHLMSQCQHFIIANSSFSWWGAWLGIHARKIVIAPKHWFGRPIKERTGFRGTLGNLKSLLKYYFTPDGARDIVPSNWVRL